jgi:hypothetical protein
MHGGVTIRPANRSGAAVGVLAVVGCATALIGFTVGGNRAVSPACDKQALERPRNECLCDGGDRDGALVRRARRRLDPLDFCRSDKSHSFVGARG